MSAYKSQHMHMGKWSNYGHSLFRLSRIATSHRFERSKQSARLCAYNPLVGLFSCMGKVSWVLGTDLYLQLCDRICIFHDGAMHGALCSLWIQKRQELHEAWNDAYFSKKSPSKLKKYFLGGSLGTSMLQNLLRSTWFRSNHGQRVT